jgi:YgiT-type zinc finger domain-containing protein
MSNLPSYDYGKCHVCGEEMQERRINQGSWLKRKPIVIESVPAGVCPLCGEKIVKTAVGQQLAMMIESVTRVPKHRSMRVPVSRYAKKLP